MFGIFLPDPTSEYTYQQQFDEVVKDMPFGDLEWEDMNSVNGFTSLTVD